MKQWFKTLGLTGISLCLSLLALPTYAKIDTQLHPVTWKGKKWEYLVEHPTDLQGIDPERFEEILDTVGQHGWHLVSVTSSFHFYAFYFERELLPHRLAAHRAHLNKLKTARKAKESQMKAKLEEAHLKKLQHARNTKMTAKRKQDLHVVLKKQMRHMNRLEATEK